MINLYYVKIPGGYFYAVGHGRYGRFDGSKSAAWSLCESCKDNLVSVLNAMQDDDEDPYNVTIESADNGIVCMQCKEAGRL